MIKYICDRCNNEVDSPSKLIKIQVEKFQTQPHYHSDYIKKDLCYNCYDKIKNILEKPCIMRENNVQ